MISQIFFRDSKDNKKWNPIPQIPGLQGPQGKPGPQGPQGIQGIQGEPGKGFEITKIYPSISDMTNDPQLSSFPIGSFLLISSQPDDPDNAKLFVTTETEVKELVDLSGANGIMGPPGPQGIQGEQGIPGPAGPSAEIPMLHIELPESRNNIQDGQTGTYTFLLDNKEVDTLWEIIIKGGIITLRFTKDPPISRAAAWIPQMMTQNRRLFIFTTLWVENIDSAPVMMTGAFEFVDTNHLKISYRFERYVTKRDLGGAEDIKILTQQEYDQLTTKSSSTLYFITE